MYSSGTAAIISTSFGMYANLNAKVVRVEKIRQEMGAKVLMYVLVLSRCVIFQFGQIDWNLRLVCLDQSADDLTDSAYIFLLGN